MAFSNQRDLVAKLNPSQSRPIRHLMTVARLYNRNKLYVTELGEFYIVHNPNYPPKKKPITVIPKVPFNNEIY